MRPIRSARTGGANWRNGKDGGGKLRAGLNVGPPVRGPPSSDKVRAGGRSPVGVAIVGRNPIGMVAGLLIAELASLLPEGEAIDGARVPTAKNGTNAVGDAKVVDDELNRHARARRGSKGDVGTVMLCSARRLVEARQQTAHDDVAHNNTVRANAFNQRRAVGPTIRGN